MAARAKDADRALARAAGRHAIVTHKEATDAGLTRHGIAHRVRTGRLWRCHPGVYSVGHPATTTKAKYLAAVRACGADSRISGLAAAYLLGLTSGPAPTPEVATPRLRRVKGIEVHECAFVGSRHMTEVDGVPASRPAVALVESASRLEDLPLSRAIHKAVVNGLTEESMRVALADRPNYSGRRRLAAFFFGDDPLVLSELERRFLALLAASGITAPLVNKLADGRFVDCRWPAKKLTVELLGFRFHNSRDTWEKDHARRREARARGDNFRAFTFEDVTDHEKATVAEVAALLAEHPSIAPVGPARAMDAWARDPGASREEAPAPQARPS